MADRHVAQLILRIALFGIAGSCWALGSVQLVTDPTVSVCVALVPVLPARSVTWALSL